MRQHPHNNQRKSISSGYIFPKIIFNFSKASFWTILTHMDPNHQIPLRPPDSGLGPIFDPDSQISPDSEPDHQIPSQTSDSSSQDQFWDPQMTPRSGPDLDPQIPHFPRKWPFPGQTPISRKSPKNELQTAKFALWGTGFSDTFAPFFPGQKTNPKTTLYGHFLGNARPCAGPNPSF